MTTSGEAVGRAGEPTEDLARFIGGVALFAGCAPETLAELAEAAGAAVVPAGTYLYRQHEAADGMAIVRTGRLEVRVEDESGDTLARAAGPGAVLGELALLTDTPRSASVRAVRDSEVVTIARGVFLELVAREPALATVIARNLAARLQASVDLAPPAPATSVCAVVAVTPDLPIDAVVDAVRAKSGVPGAVASLDGDSSGGSGDVIEYGRSLERCEARSVLTLLVVRDPRHDRSWFEFCMRSADRVVVLVGPEAVPQWALEEPALAGQDLAFVGAAFSTGHLRRSLDALRPRAHHLLRVGIDFDGDAARLARRLSGRAVGLVLSGGGARGFAHLGVIERLVEAGIEIDVAGGCSMGAFVAGMFGRGWTPQQMLTTTRAELVARKPFNDYTVPRVALIRSRKARSMLARTFGGTGLEELPRSTYVVSADLYTGELVVHTRGSLAHCVGASMSIPGLVPPLAHDGRLLVDGGLIDNLPIDVMAERHEGPIIAVDVMRRLDGASSNAPTGPLGVLPSIVETLSRATFLGSHERAARNRELSDVLISPDVDDIGLLQFDRIDRAVAAGRTAADRALDDGLRERVDAPRG